MAAAHPVAKIAAFTAEQSAELAQKRFAIAAKFARCQYVASYGPTDTDDCDDIGDKSANSQLQQHQQHQNARVKMKNFTNLRHFAHSHPPNKSLSPVQNANLPNQSSCFVILFRANSQSLTAKSCIGTPLPPPPPMPPRNYVD